LPTPEESARANPDHPMVNICPVCRKKSYYLTSICRSCKESEGGKYKTVLECFECHHKEKSEDPIVVWLDKWKIEYKTQTKASLGIGTLTDEGVK
jgi:predicted amidophosphoribosyltransferase